MIILEWRRFLPRCRRASVCVCWREWKQHVLAHNNLPCERWFRSEWMEWSLLSFLLHLDADWLWSEPWVIAKFMDWQWLWRVGNDDDGVSWTYDILMWPYVDFHNFTQGNIHTAIQCSTEWASTSKYTFLSERRRKKNELNWVYPWGIHYYCFFADT